MASLQHHLEPWRNFQPGQRFRVSSRRGNSHEATFLAEGPLMAGLYVRLVGPRLGRIDPTRLDWRTCERLDVEDPLLAGDQVFVRREGVAHRGALLRPLDGTSLALATADGPFSCPITLLERDSLRVLFRASDIRPGDELLAASLSGREYRGRVLAVTVDRIKIVLAGQDTASDLSLGRLDPDGLNVLVPVALSVLDCSPSGV